MDAYEEQYETLTEAQRDAVNWDEGALLVLAGPGSGKTRVLTSRIARILRESEGKAFRVLGLTFTNKAADEMQARLNLLCNGLEERAQIGTFHSFCMQMLQQHGSHIGVPSDFTIYSQDADRKELLKDGLRRSAGAMNDGSLVRYLQLIDKLKGLLIDVPQAAGKFKDPQEGENIARVYQAYEDELKRARVLDFNSLMLKAYQLVSSFDGIAARYRKTYKYWLVDEFQDTNRAQYKFLKALAGDAFGNVFVVADDDQIIYQWNGASFAQLLKFKEDFTPSLIQLPTNYRCPPAIVNAANNLVRHNVNRTQSKLPLVAGKVELQVPQDQSILIGAYENDQEEAGAVASLVASKPKSARGEIAVIARTKALLEGVQSSLKALNVNCVISQRRDDFLSPQYCWLHAVLRQTVRPQDRRNFDSMISSFNRMHGTKYSSDLIASAAEGSTRSLLDEWLLLLSGAPERWLSEIARKIYELSADLSKYLGFVADISGTFGVPTDEQSDLAEDARAWKSLSRSISTTYGRNLPLDQFLQHMALQSKEPPVPKETVSLMTIHGAKGKEFDLVILIGLAEEVLPSYFSLKAGADSQELEEERRNCFVAITRAKEQLVLTRAKRYRGYAKSPSRFLAEMGFPAQS